MIKCDLYTIRCGAYGFRVKPKEVKVFSVVLPFGTYNTWWRENGILKSFLPKNTEITCVEESCKNDLFNQNPNEIISNYLIHFKTTEHGYASFIRKVLDWKNSFPYQTEKPMLDFSEREYKIFLRTHPNLRWIKDQYGVPVKVDLGKLGELVNSKIIEDDTFRFTPLTAAEIIQKSIDFESKNKPKEFVFSKEEIEEANPIKKYLRSKAAKLDMANWWPLFKAF